MKKSRINSVMLKLKKKNSQRQLKVSEHLKRSLADIMKSYTFNNPAIPFNLVISEVNISIDLKVAYVFVSPFWLSEKKLGENEVIGKIDICILSDIISDLLVYSLRINLFTSIYLWVQGGDLWGFRCRTGKFDLISSFVIFLG